MALTNLYPPIVDTYMPAFTIDEGKGTCRVYFALSPYISEKDIAEVWVSVTDQNTNLPLLKTDTGLIKFNFPHPEEEEVVRVIAEPYSDVVKDGSRPGDDKYFIEFSQEQLRSGAWMADRMYKIQLRLASESFENTPGVVAGKQDLMSEWSKVCLVCPIITPELSLTGFKELEESIVSSFNNVITGRVSFKDKETLDSYRIKIYSLKDEMKLEYDSEIIYTDSFAPNEIYYQLNFGLVDGNKYRMEFEYTTKNLYHKITNFDFMVIDMAGERIDATITATPNDEMGRIEVNIASTTERYFGNLIIRRTSHKSNFTIWEDVKIITLYEASDLNIDWYDYTAESGVWYKYCVQKCTSQGARGLVVLTEKPVMLNLEDIYLTGGGRTLRIKFNPQINSFTHTLLESSSQTLGGKYPFIKRNGNLGYKQFSISGLISHLMDEGELFTNQAELYSNQNELYHSYNEKNGINDYNNLIVEKEFRDKVHEFLYDGKVKLFRSATEGSFLVRLMNTSLTPENALGRMLYTFNATAYEIDELTIENINKYNIQQVGQLEDIISGTYDGFGYIKLSGVTSLKSKCEEQENAKNMGTTLESSIDYFDKIKIQMISPPALLYFNGTSYKAIKNISAENYPIDDEDKFYSYGYVVKIIFEDEEKEIYINPNGYLELDAEGLKIIDIKWIDGSLERISFEGAIDYHFIATQRENLGLIPKHFSISPKASQVYGFFSPTEEIGKFIYQKHKYESKENYQHLYSLNAMEIEADPNTVIYLADSSQQEAKRFIVGETGILRIEDEDFIIKELSILGKSLKEKEKTIKNQYVDRVSRDYEWTNEASLAFESVMNIENPVENGLYRVRSLNGVWLPEKINNPTAGNDYLKKLKKWAEPIPFGGEKHYYVIYRQGQWYLYTSNGDMVMSTPAIITYYFDLEKGEY